jgi:predicted Rossmann fold nucleotide-binding protein DprA/Smf involved in DNA uptake
VQPNYWTDIPGGRLSWEAAPSHEDSVVSSVSNSKTVRKSVTITGSRTVDRETARYLFEQHLSSLLHQGKTWLLGGAHGIDEWAMEWLLEHNEVCWAVVPYTKAEQPKWVQPWLEQVDRVVELRLPRRKSAYAFRNRYMVDLSQLVIGFWSGKGGGTISILKHALRKRREVHAIPVSIADDPE